jgi:hypothetical protein
MATNFADLATMYWSRARHYEKLANERGEFLHKEAVRVANQTYVAHMRDTDAYLTHVEILEDRLVDADRPRSVLIGKQQFNQRMHDSCVLQAIMRGHQPRTDINVLGEDGGTVLYPINPWTGGLKVDEWKAGQ